MEELNFNLSEKEFSKGNKILLWIFASLFFLGGIYVVILSLVMDLKNVPITLSLAPFGISIVVFIIAAFATINRKDLLFTITDEKIEFRYGFLNPKRQSFKWADISEIVIPKNQNKVLLKFDGGKSFTVNLTWLNKEKGSRIKTHLYNVARDKNLTVVKVNNLS